MLSALRNKKLIKKFLRYTATSVLAMVAMSCYILADTFFIARQVGTDGLAALNFALPVYYFMYGTALMIGIGGAAVYSIAKSGGDEVTAEGAFTHTAILGAAASLLLFLAGVFLSAPLTNLFGAQNVFYETEIYIRVLLMFSPAFVFGNILTCFIRNDGAPKLAMLSMIVSSFSNIVLDYVFIIVLGMGMFGAVVATGISPVIGIAINCLHFIRRKNNFSIKKLRLSLKAFGRICALGLSSLVEQFSSALVILVFNYIILTAEGEVSVAAYGVIANISLVVLSVFTGVSQGVQPLISRARGHDNEVEGRVLLIYSLCFIFIIAAVIYVIILCFAAPIADIFNGGGDKAFTDIAEEGLRVYFIGIPFFGFNVAACCYLTASGRALPAQIVSLLRGLVIIIPMAFGLSHLSGLIGVWLSWPVTEAIVVIVAAVLLFAKRNRQAV